MPLPIVAFPPKLRPHVTCGLFRVGQWWNKQMLQQRGPRIPRNGLESTQAGTRALWNRSSASTSLWVGLRAHRRNGAVGPTNGLLCAVARKARSRMAGLMRRLAPCVLSHGVVGILGGLVGHRLHGANPQLASPLMNARRGGALCGLWRWKAGWRRRAWLSLGGERDTAVRASIASNGYLFGEAGASPMKSE
jgi:hypothetical protein